MTSSLRPRRALAGAAAVPLPVWQHAVRRRRGAVQTCASGRERRHGGEQEAGKVMGDDSESYFCAGASRGCDDDV